MRIIELNSLTKNLFRVALLAAAFFSVGPASAESGWVERCSSVLAHVEKITLAELSEYERALRTGQSTDEIIARIQKRNSARSAHEIREWLSSRSSPEARKLSTVEILRASAHFTEFQKARLNQLAQTADLQQSWATSQRTWPERYRLASLADHSHRALQVVPVEQKRKIMEQLTAQSGNRIGPVLIQQAEMRRRVLSRIESRNAEQDVELATQERLLHRVNRELEMDVALRVEKFTSDLIGFNVRGDLINDVTGAIEKYETDIETSRAFIEVTNGHGSKAHQLLRVYLNASSVNPAGKPVIVYAPDMSLSSVEKTIEKIGAHPRAPVVFVRNFEELEKALRLLYPAPLSH